MRQRDTPRYRSVQLGKFGQRTTMPTAVRRKRKHVGASLIFISSGCRCSRVCSTRPYQLQLKPLEPRANGFSRRGINNDPGRSERRESRQRNTSGRTERYGNVWRGRLARDQHRLDIDRSSFVRFRDTVRGYSRLAARQETVSGLCDLHLFS